MLATAGITAADPEASSEAGAVPHVAVGFPPVHVHESTTRGSQVARQKSLSAVAPRLQLPLPELVEVVVVPPEDVVVVPADDDVDVDEAPAEEDVSAGLVATSGPSMCVSAQAAWLLV